MKKLALALGLLLSPVKIGVAVCLALGGGVVSAQVAVPQDPSATTVDEYAQGGMALTQVMPIKPSDIPIEWGSDMPWAWEHDARWGVKSASAIWGANSRITSLFSKGNTFFVKTGDTFGKILNAYMEIQKLMELYNQMEASWKFIENYQLKVNLYRFLPVIDYMAPAEMGGGQAFAVGILPKDSSGWEARNNVLQDNPWRRKNSLRLVEVRYPRSLSDLTLDASVWGPQTTDEEEFQKMLLAGVYDGVMSASSWMENAGIANNMADNVAPLGPKAFARRKEAILMKRITALQERRDFLNRVANGV